MNNKNVPAFRLTCARGAIGALPRLATLALALACPALAGAQAPAVGSPATAPALARHAVLRTAPAAAAPALQPCQSVAIDPVTTLALGKSQVVRLPFPAARIVVGGMGSARAGRPLNSASSAAGSAPPATAAAAGSAGSGGVADTEVTLLSPTELFFLGRQPGSMNVVLQGADGRCLVKDIVVTVDPAALQATFRELIPDEPGVNVRAAEGALVLTGTVRDAGRMQQLLAVAGAYGDRKLVNLVQVSNPQQVMLEVKIAEVSKTLLDRLGSRLNISRSTSSGANVFSAVSNFLSGGGTLLEAMRTGWGTLALEANKTDGLVRVLAEPNILAVSGQSASFLSGGKIFIPVAQNANGTTGTTITLEEKEFGVGLKFTPTVLDGGRINLKLVSEASELSQTGSPFATVNGTTAVLPSFTTRRVDTTVQLGDGQSFVVAGLIRNNSKEALERLPGVGEVPVVGALFRSTEFQNEQTELMFVVTPRLVKPLEGPIALPTDHHVPPTRNEALVNGALESPAAPVAQPKE